MGQRRNISFTHVAITDRWASTFDCNELTLINKGTQNVTISDCFTLTPEQSITYYALPDEVNATIYTLTFPTNVNGCLVIAICKKYLD